MTKFRENKQKKEKSAFFFENLCIKALFRVIYGIFFVILRRYLRNVLRRKAMRNIPQVTKGLLIVNIVAFIICVLVGGSEYRVNGELMTDYTVNSIFGLYFFKAQGFQPYQLLTYMFMHGSWAHLFFNMFALWMFGCVVERVWGPKKFLFYYILCGIGAGLTQEIAQYVAYLGLVGDRVMSLGTTVGASGSIYGILLAFGMIFPEERIFIFPLPVPIKAKYFVVGYAVIELVEAFSLPGDGVAHMAHLGGMLFGFFLIRHWQKHPTSGYGRAGGQQFFENLRSSWEKRSKKPSATSTGNPDWDYNAREKAKQDEIDRILDKIRKSGYDSLSKSEKQTLFDQSRQR
jgi:membrane associated rhomboid family serine protease